ncbi:MAG: hypothetical protein OXH22_06460 [Chloroflexi bacterium]|nr:hypothetical protein [Chloroflexota bacterium]
MAQSARADVGSRGEGSLRLFALDVGKSFRNIGVGTALIDAVEAAAIGLGLYQVNLEVSTEKPTQHGSMNALDTGTFRNQRPTPGMNWMIRGMSIQLKRLLG